MKILLGMFIGAGLVMFIVLVPVRYGKVGLTKPAWTCVETTYSYDCRHN